MTTSIAIHESPSDEALLRRFASGREADAFAELARRHAGLVYGTCLRVTGDRHDAEELAQESFFRLARRASSVRSSVAGWLHATATTLSLNAVRARGRRRAHEAAGARAPSDQPADPTAWREIEPILDEAVDALPDELREAIVLHFLRSLPQAEVAARLGVHQSTVSRRVAEGLRRLNDRLTASGVSLAALPLADALVAAANPAGVPDLSTPIARAALTGAAGGLLGGLGAAWAKLKGVGLLILGLLPAVVVESIAGIAAGAAAAAAWVAFLAWLRPRWIDDLWAGPDGGSHYDDPFFPFRRWTWDAMPAGWKRRMGLSAAIGVMFWSQAWFLARPRPGRGNPPVAGVWIVYGLLAFSTSARIAWKAARTLPTPATAAAQSPAPLDPSALGQSLGFAVASLLWMPCMIVGLARMDDRPGVLAVISIVLVVGSIGAWLDAARKIRRFRQDRTASIRAEDPTPERAWSRGLLLAVLLGFSALMASGPLAADGIARGNPQYAASPQGSTHLEGARGMQPALGLLFLATTIRPLMLSRSSMRRSIWLILVAFAILLAMVDAAACVAYLGSLIRPG